MSSFFNWKNNLKFEAQASNIKHIDIHSFIEQWAVIYNMWNSIALQVMYIVGSILMVCQKDTVCHISATLKNYIVPEAYLCCKRVPYFCENHVDGQSKTNIFA